MGEEQTLYYSRPCWGCYYFHHLLLLYMPKEDEKEKKGRKVEVERIKAKNKAAKNAARKD